MHFKISCKLKRWGGGFEKKYFDSQLPSNCFLYVSSNTFYDKKQYLFKFSTNDIIFDFIYVKS